MSSVESGGQAEFFVHPDFHRIIGNTMLPPIEKYEQELHHRIDVAELPILICNPDEYTRAGEFWKRFPADRKFNTVDISGRLDGEGQISRFNALLEESAVLQGVIHGSYLSQCIRKFKHGLAADEETGLIQYEHGRTLDNVTHNEKLTSVTYGIVLCNSIRPGFNAHAIPDVDIKSTMASALFAGDAQVFAASRR